MNQFSENWRENKILEHFQEKCVAVFRPEMCKNKELEHCAGSDFREVALASGDLLANKLNDDLDIYDRVWYQALWIHQLQS